MTQADHCNPLINASVVRIPNGYWRFFTTLQTEMYPPQPWNVFGVNDLWFHGPHLNRDVFYQDYASDTATAGTLRPRTPPTVRVEAGWVYVSPITGNNGTANGSLERPYATVAEALRQDHTCLFLLPGDYHESQVYISHSVQLMGYSAGGHCRLMNGMRIMGRNGHILDVYVKQVDCVGALFINTDMAQPGGCIQFEACDLVLGNRSDSHHTTDVRLRQCQVTVPDTHAFWASGHSYFQQVNWFIYGEWTVDRGRCWMHRNQLDVHGEGGVILLPSCHCRLMHCRPWTCKEVMKAKQGLVTVELDSYTNDLCSFSDLFNKMVVA